MLLFSILAAVAVTPPPASTPASERAAAAGVERSAEARDCQHPGAKLTADAMSGYYRKLGDLPPANHVLTLFRTVGGCAQPVIVRYGIGAAGRGR